MKYGGKSPEELRSLLRWSTPGDWEVDSYDDRSASREAYPVAKVICDHPFEHSKTADVCDTLNAESCFSPEDRRANMECLVAAREALLPLLERVQRLEEALVPFAKLGEHRSLGKEVADQYFSILLGIRNGNVTQAVISDELFVRHFWKAAAAVKGEHDEPVG